MRLSRLILCGLVLLSAAQVGHAGPLKRLFGRVRCHGVGCRPTATQSAPTRVPTTAAAQVVQTSYSGVGVPIDATPYRPIRLAVPLSTGPACVGGSCPR